MILKVYLSAEWPAAAIPSGTVFAKPAVIVALVSAAIISRS